MTDQNEESRFFVIVLNHKSPCTNSQLNRKIWYISLNFQFPLEFT